MAWSQAPAMWAQVAEGDNKVAFWSSCWHHHYYFQIHKGRHQWCSSGNGDDGNDPNENTSGQGPVKKYLMLVVSSLVQLPGIVDVNIWNN